MVQVIAAEGERDASESLKEAAKVIQRSPQALQVTGYFTLTLTSTSNPFLCAADFFLQLGSC